jgi:hypothetical protein
MVAVPAATPPAVPVPDPIVATVVGLLVHVPPPVASVNVPVVPTQIDGGPTGIAGTGSTVNVAYTSHPLGIW